jgi:hypothetical protein
MTTKPSIDWLLEKNQPAVRYYALTDLLDRRENDAEAKRARSRIARVGWAKSILSVQKPKGFWDRQEPKTLRSWMNFLQFPAYRTTMYRALVLSDLGMTSADPRIRKAAELIFEYKLRTSSPFNFFTEEVCAVGNISRMMARFGYGEDYRIRKLNDWMVEDQRDDGGWNCAPNQPGTLDCWEALAAFAEIPKAKRSPGIERAISRGAEFYLERKLFEEGKKYPPWLRFHYPVHYFYDLLVGLDVLTKLGYGADRRMKPALEILKDKRRSDGSWILDRMHPDVGPGVMSPEELKKQNPFSLETVGEPSKWITLTALRVLKRVDEAN